MRGVQVENWIEKSCYDGHWTLKEPSVVVRMVREHAGIAGGHTSHQGSQQIGKKEWRICGNN